MTDTTYTIQMASKISGVGVHTIRAWEKRYKALVPERDASGHRTYTKSDIEKLMLLSELCLLGYTISKVATLTTPELKEQLRSLGKSDESLQNQDFNLIHDTKADVDPSQSLPILSFAIRTYNLDVINVELTKLKGALSSHSYALKVIIPLFEILSDLFRSGAYQNHQEQAVRSLLRFHSGFNLYHPVEKKEKGSVNAILTGVDGDTNDLLLGVAGLLCGHYGFHYTYLGPNLSSESVLDIVKSFEANLLIIGPVSSQMSARELQSFTEKVMGKLVDHVDVVVIGNCDLDLSKMPTKRLVHFKDIGKLDHFLNNYLSKS